MDTILINLVGNTPSVPVMMLTGRATYNYKQVSVTENDAI